VTAEPNPRKHPKGKGCWYLVSIFECPICSRSTTYRERRYDPKPTDPRQRTEIIADACGGHFL
jgi:hypothetical protein